MRVTEKDLENMVAEINAATGSPKETYTSGEANIGNYHLSSCYGGLALHRITNTSGGIKDISGMGHTTKKELYTFLNGFINGLERSTQKEGV